MTRTVLQNIASHEYLKATMYGVCSFIGQVDYKTILPFTHFKIPFALSISNQLRPRWSRFSLSFPPYFQQLSWPCRCQRRSHSLVLLADSLVALDLASTYITIFFYRDVSSVFYMHWITLYTSIVSIFALVSTPNYLLPFTFKCSWLKIDPS